MSTPTTVAALPHYQNHHHRYHQPYSPYLNSHQNHNQQSTAASTIPHTAATTSASGSASTSAASQNHRSVAANSLLHPQSSAHANVAGPLPSPTTSSTLPKLSPRLLSRYPPAPSTAYPSSNVASRTPQQPHQAHQQQLQSPVPPPHAAYHRRSDQESHHTPSSSGHRAIDDTRSTMATAGTMVTTRPDVAHDGFDGSQSSRKRRRSKGPDWQTFYAKGLPREVIVIDDTPEPESQANTSRKIQNPAPAPATASSSQPPKKKRRDEPTYHIQYNPQAPSPHQQATPNHSTLSSDRTNSAAQTTAPTSLSSNGHYDEQPAAAKRKRTTRQQTANEAKRRDIEGAGKIQTYKPPPYPPRKVKDVDVKVIKDPPYSTKVKVDDDDGHYIVVPDTDLTEKYVISRLLGQGTFGKVVQARERKTNRAVAIKIIRSVQKYRDASRIELRVLATLKANDAENRNRCIHFRECFDYRGHICIVTDLLGQSVFDFLKGNNFVPFPNSQIQNFARQLFTSVAFLHDLNLIHTDLKPENILLWNDTYQTFTYNRTIPSSSSTVNRSSPHRRVLLDTEIRLIDFGSATFQDEYHSSVVSTRHYRAPEIILGLGWSYPCDIWSIGCILVEFYTGDALFQTHDNLEHLAMMEAVVGRPVDGHLVQQVRKISQRGGRSEASKYFKGSKLAYPLTETTRGSRRFVRAMKRLEQIIPSQTTFFRNFLDLLRKIFVYDASQRITAKQALQHPFFREIGLADDGTEAARLRAEKELALQEAQRQPVYVG